MRIRTAVMLLALGSASAWGAPKALEPFDLWRVPTPKGWVKKATPGFLNFAYEIGHEPSQLGLYPARARALDSFEKELEKEWAEIVLSNGTAGPRKDGKDRRLASGVVVREVAAETRSKGGVDSYTVLYVMAPYGQIVSIAVSSASAGGFRRLHEKTIAAFLDGLELDVVVVAKRVADATGGVGPPANVPGRWAASSGGGFAPAGSVPGSARRQYELRKDGTYTHRQELWGGSLRSEEWTLLEESGTYALEDNRLTISPRAGTSVVKNRAGDVVRTAKPTLSAVTYLWRFHHFEGLGETQLVLTPPGPTDRDGPLAANDAFRDAYLLSAKHVPEWHVFPK